MANFAPVGRRNNKLGTPKAELVDVVTALTKLGIGATTIARMLGYHETRIFQVCREFGIVGVGRESNGVLQFICDHLPPDLKAQCLRISTRSLVAKTAIANKRAQVEARTVHHLLDDDSDILDNTSPKPRPEEAKEAA